MSDNKSIKTTGSSIETRLLSVLTYKTNLQEYLASFKRTICQRCYWSVRTCIFTYSTVVWYWQLLQATVYCTTNIVCVFAAVFQSPDPVSLFLIRGHNNNNKSSSKSFRWCWYNRCRWSRLVHSWTKSRPWCTATTTASKKPAQNLSVEVWDIYSQTELFTILSDMAYRNLTMNVPDQPPLH